MTAPPLTWVSPLPPARTDIGHYSARLLPELSKHFKIQAWAPQTEADNQLSAFAEIRQLSDERDWRGLNEGGLSLYHLGNNSAFHLPILELARQRPGLAVLHDRVLQHMAWEGLGPQRYRDAMLREYGQAGMEAADRMIRGETDPTALAEELPLAGLALDNALAVLTHSESTAAALRASPRRLPPPVYVLPLPFAPGTPPTSSPGQMKPSVEQPLRLIQFGYLGPNRRLDWLFAAMAGLDADDRSRIHLDIYGRIWGRSMLDRQIGEYGLTNHVTVHGFVEEDALDSAIARADLAINLRWPSMGEASGSQLRIWRHKRPSIAIRTGWYAEQPEDAMLFVEPPTGGDGDPARAIRAHLKAAIETPQMLAGIGAAGRDRLERMHAPDHYVSGLLDIIEDRDSWWRQWHGRRLASRLGARLKDAPANLADHPGLDRLAGRMADRLVI